MKFFLAPLLALLAAFTVHAQADFSLLGDDLSWVQEYFLSTGEEPDTTLFNEYAVVGDTVLNGQAYRLVGAPGYLPAILREEAGRLIRNRNDREEVLMDFNLTVNDTLFFAECSAPDAANCYAIVTSVDSIVVMDGSLRRRLNLAYSAPTAPDITNFDICWIDGIGTSAGLLGQAGCGVLEGNKSLGPVCLKRLVCVQYNGVFLYNNTETDFRDCTRSAVTSLGDSPTAGAGVLDVFPNPFSGRLTVRSRAGTPIESITLRTVTGALVLRRAVSAAENVITLRVGDVPSGVYVLRVGFGDGRFASSKIVRQ